METDGNTEAGFTKE